MPLTPGGIAIIAYNSDGNNDFAWVALVDIPAGEVINFTDSSWQDTGFRITEHLNATDGGPLTWSHTSLLTAGTVINFSGSAWNIGTGTGGFLDLATAGDQIFAFQGSTASPTFIYGTHFASGTNWLASGSNSTNTSNLPPGLSTTNPVTASYIGNFDNGYYSGITTGTKTQILNAIGNPANWTRRDSNGANTDGSFAQSNWVNSFTIIVSQPDLTISLSDSPDPVTAGTGNILIYTLTASNNGTVNATNVNINFTLPAGVTLLNTTQSNGFTRIGNSGTISFTGGNINAGSNVVLTANVEVYNAGILTSGTAVIDPSNTITEINESNNTAAAISTTVNPGQPDLSPGISTPGPLTVGTAFNYTLDIQNNGGNNASGVELTFTLPANVTYNSANILGGGFNSPTINGSSLTFTGGSINAGAFAQIQVNVTPTQAGTLSGTTLVADPNNNIAESNEANNSVTTGTFTVNASAGITINQSGGSTNLAESGATDTYTIVLNNQPTADVNITINSGNQTTSNTTNITFTTANWNTAQTVTLTANDDAIVEGNHTQIISHTANSSDNNYNGISIANITANITDNDIAGITINQSGGSTNLAESGATDTYTIVLNNQPTADVNITINSGNQTTSNTTNITFTTANWNTAQTVTLTANDDAIVEGNHTQIISHTANSSDNNYNGILIANITANITDNDAQTKIHDIQGTGATFNPTFGGTQTIEGIVTRAFQGSTKLNGFYIQEEDADADADPTTSEAIFVYDPSGLFSGNVGDKVRITGTVGEYTSGTGNSLTQLSSLTNVTNLGASTLPTITNIQFPVANVSNLERYEGMLVNISAASGELTVTENFQLGRFGQIVLAATGSSNQPGTDARLDQYTQFNNPSVSAYSAYQADIAKRKIYLDDGSGTSNPDPILFGRGGNPLSATNTLRSGDTVANITGILDQRFEGYRIQTSTPVNFNPTNSRPNTPPDVGSSATLKVASANVLNFFNGDGAGGGFPTARGANNLNELNRQRAKIVQELVNSGADVVGLMELENDGYGSTSAIADLVNALNGVAGAGTYAFVNPANSLGTDQIAVGMIYKPGKVTPVGAAATMPNGYGQGAFDLVGRKPLAQTFQQNSNGEKFTAVVNHFKSKGSSAGGVGDADAGDGQGFSNGTRTRQAQDLSTWLATNPTGTTDPDYLILGDLNAYAQENPLTTLASAGYNNLISPTSYSFVFDGQVGSLDHALATSSLATQVTGAEKWHINADEPNVLDYNTEFKSAGQQTSLYNADQFRASDHDPVIVGLNLTPPIVTIQAIDANAAEAGNDVGVFRITRTGSVVASLNVSYTVAGQATSNDYNPALTGVATIAPGQSFLDVTITPVDDSVVEASETVTLNLVDTADYDLGATNTATVTIADNDISGVTISKSNTNITEGGANDNYTVVLTSQPTAPVTINVTPNNNQINLGAGAGNPLSLNFTPNTWNLAQTVTVTAVDDTQIEGNHTSNISHSATSSDSNYNINIGNVAVNITDNDTAPLNLSLIINPNSFSEGAGGNAATATITRTGSTTSQLTVNLSSNDTSEATVPNSVIIPVGQTAANFGISAVEDNIVDGSQTATITSAANGFTNAIANVTVTDNDAAGVTIIQPPNGLNLAEGGAISGYSIFLNSQPSAEVGISFNTGTQIYPISSINFTPTNWNIAQNITVAAVDDTAVEGTHAGTVSHKIISNDANYNGLSIPLVIALITDNDIATPDDCCGGDELEEIVKNSYSGQPSASNPPHDFIVGDANSNLLVGGIGNDTIFGRSGDDLIFGNQGQDIINGNEGDDIIFAGKDNDFVRGGKGNDYISGDLGNDTLSGDAGNDTVLGMLGDDVLFGNKGDDVLNGNQGKDTVCGGEGNDLVRGGQDDDLVSGGTGNDTLFGDMGNDTICGCEGNDWLTGGEGRDTFVLKSGNGSDMITDFVVGQDLLRFTNNLSFSNLNITQGDGNQAANTLIRITATNELLASLIGVSASSITPNSIAFVS